jgi:ABC-type amino acid transport substrate-binding protein
LFGSKKGALKALGIVIVVALVSTSFLGCLGGTSSGVDAIKARGYIIVGTSTGFPPFDVINTSTGQPDGFDMDIAREIASSLGVSIRFQDLDFNVLVGSVKTGTIDMAVAGMTITPTRNLSISFSNSYWKADQAILVQASNNDIHNVSDLTGKKIAVNTGTTGDFWVADNLVATGLVSQNDVTSFGFAADAVLDLTSGRVDAVVIDKPVADAYAQKAPSQLKVVFTIVTDEHYGIAMKKDSNLVSYVNGVLADMQASGKLDQLRLKWFGA